MRELAAAVEATVPGVTADPAATVTCDAGTLLGAGRRALDAP